MISVEKGTVCVKGSRSLLMAEFAGLINSFVEQGVFDWEDINFIVQTAKMPVDEIERKTIECLEDILQWFEDH